MVFFYHGVILDDGDAFDRGVMVFDDGLDHGATPNDGLDHGVAIENGRDHGDVDPSNWNGDL